MQISELLAPKTPPRGHKRFNSNSSSRSVSPNPHKRQNIDPSRSPSPVPKSVLISDMDGVLILNGTKQIDDTGDIQFSWHDGHKQLKKEDVHPDIWKDILDLPTNVMSFVPNHPLLRLLEKADFDIKNLLSNGVSSHVQNVVSDPRMQFGVKYHFDQRNSDRFLTQEGRLQHGAELGLPSFDNVPRGRQWDTVSGVTPESAVLASQMRTVDFENQDENMGHDFYDFISHLNPKHAIDMLQKSLDEVPDKKAKAVYDKIQEKVDKMTEEQAQIPSLKAEDKVLPSENQEAMRNGMFIDQEYKPDAQKGYSVLSEYCSRSNINPNQIGKVVLLEDQFTNSPLIPHVLQKWADIFSSDPDKQLEQGFKGSSVLTIDPVHPLLKTDSAQSIENIAISENSFILNTPPSENTPLNRMSINAAKDSLRSRGLFVEDIA